MAHASPDDLALLALGEPADADILTHVRSCAQCRAEVEGLTRVVERGRTVSEADVLYVPSAAVWEGIRSALAEPRGSRVVALHGGTVDPAAPAFPPAAETKPAGERPAEPAAAPAADDTARGTSGEAPPPPAIEVRRQRRWATLALAAAVALIVGLVGFGAGRALTPKNDVVGVTTLNALPRWHGSNGTATVEQDTQGNRTLVITTELTPTISVDGRFEVWMSDSRADDMISMGILPGTSGRFAIPAAMDLKSHPIIDISLEPNNDTDPKHSSISVLRGRLAL